MTDRRSFLAACGAFFAGLAWWRNAKEENVADLVLSRHRLAEIYEADLVKLNEKVLCVARDMGVEIRPQSTDTTGWKEIISFPQCRVSEMNGDPLGGYFEKMTASMVSNLRARNPRCISPLKVLPADSFHQLRTGIIVYFPILA